MALKEDFENAGNWLFRRRSYLPLGAIGLFLLAMRNYAYPGQSENLADLWGTFCLLISFCGLGIRIYTIGYTPRKTSGRNTRKQVAEALNTTGIYSIVRNPLYLGNLFMGLGIALFTFLWWLVLIYMLLFWLYYERIIFAEEAFLREKFGDKFMAWSDSTPVFWPNFSQYRKSPLPFSWKNVLKREYNGFFAVIVAMFLMKTVGTLYVEGSLHFDPVWVWLLGIGFTTWIVLRSLKKYTKILHVEGR